MSQTAYNLYQAAAFAGMLADLANKRVVSRAAENAINFGSPVIAGTDPATQVKTVPTSGTGQGALVTGFALATHAVEQTSAGEAQYAAKNTVSVLKEGQLWVNTDDAVTAGATANLKLSNGKLTDEAVATGIEAFAQVKVRFVTGTTAAGLAIVEVSPI